MFRYALVDRDGEVFDDYESLISNWQPGDELRAAGNVRYRVVSVVPIERVQEFVGQPLCGMLEVERL
jgi:hypothetical protein